MNGLLLAFLLTVVPGQTDTIRTPAVALSVRQRILPAQLPASSTEVRAAELESAGILSPKQLSSLVPGLHMPVYGASMTSTIYMRGFGSRMENPVIGLYVDDIPILDKNVYDFDFLDLRSEPDYKPAISSVPYYQVFASRHGFMADLSIADLLFNMGPEGLLVLRDMTKQA